MNDIICAPWSVLDSFDDSDNQLHAFDLYLLFHETLDEHAP